jgi:hypothetical protein
MKKLEYVIVVRSDDPLKLEVLADELSVTLKDPAWIERGVHVDQVETRHRILEDVAKFDS